MSGSTVAIVTPENCIPRKKNNMKSLATSPPRKDPISNQDINMLGTKNDQSCLPQIHELEKQLGQIQR